MTEKEPKKNIIRIDFENPLPSIKKPKKASLKPQEQEIQAVKEQEIAKSEEISNSARETITHYKELVTTSETPLSELPFIEPKQENEFEKIEELEKKLKEQKELLIIKKKEEKLKKKLEEKLKGKRSLINPLRWFGLKYKKKKELKLEEKIKEPEILEQQSQTEIRLTEDFLNLKFCPICNCKLKKEKVRRIGEIYTQNLKCKKCNFTKKIVFKL